MTTIRFSIRAVAFLDILGFKELVRDAHATESGLRRLSKVMRKMKTNLPLNRGVNPGVPNPLHPLATEISDSIILSTPIEPPEAHQYSGLAVMIMRCAQLAAILLEEGYLLNGAIDIGPIHHTRRNIVGHAYQEAFSAQSALSSPAIMLSPEAERDWEESYFGGGQSNMCLHRAVVLKCKDGQGLPTTKEHEALIVNVFQPDYMNSVRAIRKNDPRPKIDNAWLTERATKIEKTIRDNLTSFGKGAPNHNASVLAKWQWFEKLFNEAGKPGLEELHIPFPETS